MDIKPCVNLLRGVFNSHVAFTFCFAFACTCVNACACDLLALLDFCCFAWLAWLGLLGLLHLPGLLSLRCLNAKWKEKGANKKRVASTFDATLFGVHALASFVVNAKKRIVAWAVL